MILTGDKVLRPVIKPPVWNDDRLFLHPVTVHSAVGFMNSGSPGLVSSSRLGEISL